MGDFRTVRLWTTTLAPREFDPCPMPRERLRNALEEFRQRAAMLASEIPRDLREPTVHDVTHLDGLWEIADIIVGPSVDLTPAEAFVIGGAFLVHDLGMAVAAYPEGLKGLQARTDWDDLLRSILRQTLDREPKEGEISSPPPEATEDVKFWMLRKLHAEHAERLASICWTDSASGASYHLIENPELRNALGPIIGRIAHSHWWPTSQLASEFRTVIGPPVSFPAQWTIDPLKLALILRLADAAHLDGRRAPSFLKVLRGPTGLSKLHWTFQEKLYQVHLQGDRLAYTSQPFTTKDAQSWWLCYNMLRIVDAELRRADDLNADLQRQRFAARGVRGAEDPMRMREVIPTQGWIPVEARVKVSRVASLVRKLAGKELYGDDQTVPLRELLQNASNAVRARRVLENRNPQWGTVYLRTGEDEYGAWIEVEDNGVGMSEEVLTGSLLDFGISFWSTPEATTQFPTLLAKGFHSTGQYGIGFFSVFMWGDRVRVTTRRLDEAVKDTHVLEFESGLDARPLLRAGQPGEGIIDGGTCVRVWPRSVRDASGDWLALPTTLWPRVFSSPAAAAYWLSPTLDVDLQVEVGSVSGKIIQANDWLDLSGEDLLKRVEFGSSSKTPERAAAGANVRAMYRDERVVGRACIWPGHRNGCVTIGGLRAKTEINIAGVLIGSSRRASREEADVSVTSEELGRWATEQAALITGVTKEAQARCADLIANLGGDVGDLPIATSGGQRLDEPKSVGGVGTRQGSRNSG